MKTTSIVSLCLAGRLTFHLIACDVCWRINSRQLPQYESVKPNARSNQMIISRTSTESARECEEFAATKKALAFNYGTRIDPTDRGVGDRNRSKPRNVCLALECPEISNSTLVRDEHYKYYSAYPSFRSTDSSFTTTCVPRMGLFLYSSDRLNYSDARTACRKMNASLAHVISEERTNELAKRIPTDVPTFVGLSSQNGSATWKNEFDEPLSCFDYRAWGTGEPSHSKGCVAIVKPSKSFLGPFWRVTRCGNELPFICEVSPNLRRSRN